MAPAEQATLLVANDADNSLLAQARHAAPAAEPRGSRTRRAGQAARSLCRSDATHPVPGGAAPIAQVFLACSSVTHGATKRSEPERSCQIGPELAVVNLTGAFAASHPSGLETETLTVLSICATLHANLPRVTQVRFLVDGQPRATLAGHADLTRTYLAAEAVPTEGAHP